METTQMWIDKQIMAYPHDGMSLSNKRSTDVHNI